MTATQPATSIAEIDAASYDAKGNKLPRPIVSYRVVIRETGVALRRGSIDLPEFGKPSEYFDALAEFPSEITAQLAIDHIRWRTPVGRTLRADQWVAEPQVWAGLTPEQENALLCKIRDTVIWLGHVELYDYMTPARRGMVGVEPRRVG